jgi:hypothetical protein
MLVAWVRRHCRHVVSVRWLSLSSSPWILLYPQVGLSVAIRTISAASASSIGGRPGRFG